MSEAWIEIVDADGARRRHALKSGLTTVGGRRADIELRGSEGDQLHFWDQPPKLVFVGGGAQPTLNGRACEESSLAHGDVVLWRGARIEFGAQARAPANEPAIPALERAAPSDAAPAASYGAGEELAWKRVKSALLVDLGLAESSSSRRWKDALARNEFDPDACARDILAATPDSGLARPLLERSAQLQRDLLAPARAAAPPPPPPRKPSPRAERAPAGTKRGIIAVLITQVFIFVIWLAIALVTIFVVRLHWHWSIDAFCDQMLERFTKK